jgi:signal transduction histidine kinase
MADDSIAGDDRSSPEQAFAQRVLAAREDERRRIARELHDDTSQALTSLMVGLETVRYAHEHDPRAVPAQIDTLSAIARGALSGISRLIRGLRPAALEGRDLLTAVRDHAAHIEVIYGIHVETQVQGSVPADLAPAIESGLYRMVQEATTNAAKHALARQVSVTIFFRGRVVRVLIEDDGVGFDASTGEGSTGSGLTGLAERTQALGGTLEVDSVPGSGTQVVIDLPVGGGGST